MQNKSLKRIIRKGLCSGCGTCAGMCPEDCISIRLDLKRGIYSPEIDEDKCINCGICCKVCPGYELEFAILEKKIFNKKSENELIGNMQNCYIGHSTNYNIRYNSSSGGMITQLLIFVLQQKLIDGIILTKMKQENPLEAYSFIARTEKDIIEASKSKYCPVPLNSILKEILESKPEERFAIVGLPCHIQGIRKAEEVNRILKEKIVLHIGIVCNHTPTFLATEFLLRHIKIRISDVVKLDYRGEGWPGAMKIKTSNGQIINVPQFSPYYWGFAFNSFFYPYRCTLCDDKTGCLSDASFADAWINEIIEKDRIGMSVIISRNDKSEAIISKAAENSDIMVEKADDQILIKSQGLLLVRKRISARIKLMKLIGFSTPRCDKILACNSIIDYCDAMTFYINYLLSKRKLFPFIELLISLRINIIYILSILKGKRGLLK